MLVSLLTLNSYAQTETDISIRWCLENEGIPEVVFDDNTRVDCLTSSHAIEFEWAYNWAEAVGQSLKYASNSGRRAGIMLILKSEKDEKYFHRLSLMINHYGLPIDASIHKLY